MCGHISYIIIHVYEYLYVFMYIYTYSHKKIYRVQSLQCR